jgi:hypothetical protein
MRLADPAARKTGKSTAEANHSPLLLASAGQSNDKSVIPAACACNIDTNEYNFSKYKEIKSQLISLSSTWLGVLDKYSNILRDDSVKFGFVMQPILARGINKQLADYEVKMQQIDLFRSGGVVVKKGASNRFVNGSDTRVDFSKAGRLGSKDGLNFLTYKYFYDDYLTGAVKSMAERKGFAYCDMNIEIQGLGKDFDFYTDYCHLTKQGYKYTAERIGAMVVEKNWIK